MNIVLFVYSQTVHSSIPSPIMESYFCLLKSSKHGEGEEFTSFGWCERGHESMNIVLFVCSHLVDS